MKILLISGFLGAGKTSFIKYMAKATGRQFVIIENEFAEKGVDSQILKQGGNAAKMQIYEMSEGCICCSLNLDFAYSVLTISNTLDPDYLVVEPSGVAQPSKIVESLARIEYEKISMLAPITIVDAENFRIQEREFANYFNDQLISAGTVVLSKSENLSESEFSEIKAGLNLASDVKFPLMHYSKWPKSEWMELFTNELSAKDLKNIGERFHTKNIKREADTDLDNVSTEKAHFNSLSQIYSFFSSVLTGKFGYIVRAKGFCRLSTPDGDEFVHIELSGSKFSLTGLGELTESEISEAGISEKLIFIGKFLDKEKITSACTV